jgi:hypothetical protein
MPRLTDGNVLKASVAFDPRGGVGSFIERAALAVCRRMK